MSEATTVTSATVTTDQLKAMSISAIASFIVSDWNAQLKPKGKRVAPLNSPAFAAYPYLTSMRSLQSIKDKDFMESGQSVVLYFLSNAAQYRGENAKLVKAELKRRLREECGYSIK